MCVADDDASLMHTHRMTIRSSGRSATLPRVRAAARRVPQMEIVP